MLKEYGQGLCALSVVLKDSLAKPTESLSPRQNQTGKSALLSSSDAALISKSTGPVRKGGSSQAKTPGGSRFSSSHTLKVEFQAEEGEADDRPRAEASRRPLTIKAHYEVLSAPVSAKLGRNDS